MKAEPWGKTVHRDAAFLFIALSGYIVAHVYRGFGLQLCVLAVLFLLVTVSLYVDLHIWIRLMPLSRDISVAFSELVFDIANLAAQSTLPNEQYSQISTAYFG